jgi:hypothetical protein
MITREQAHWIARKYVRKHLPGGCSEIRAVRSSDELSGRRPFLFEWPDERLCRFPEFDGDLDSLNHSWIAYCERPKDEPLMLCSSTIIIISKDSGKILYAGTALDEG